MGKAVSPNPRGTHRETSLLKVEEVTTNACIGKLRKP